MEASTVSFGQLLTGTREVAQRLLTIGENRMELLAVEAEEGRGLLLRAVALTFSIAACALLAGITLTAAIAYLLWPWSPLAALLLPGTVWSATAIILCRRLTRLCREWKTLPASLEELRKDRECLAKLLA